MKEYKAQAAAKRAREDIARKVFKKQNTTERGIFDMVQMGLITDEEAEIILKDTNQGGKKETSASSVAVAFNTGKI